MSKVNDVDVRAGAVVVEGKGADGQAGGGKVVEVCPGLVWFAGSRAFENLL